jgi:hypothetical protein
MLAGLTFRAGAAVAPLACGDPAGAKAACQVFGDARQPAKVMGWPDQQAAVVTTGQRRPFQGRAGAGFLQKAQPGSRAGFERATDTTTIAGLSFRGFGRGAALEMNDLFFHFAL